MDFGEKDNFSWKIDYMDDAERWNRRYTNDWRNSFELPRKLLTDHVDLLPANGLALDIAMGLGGNACFLLSLGLRVIGVDISYVAVRRAKSKNPSLMAVVADLNHFFIPENAFCIITDFLYLERELWVPMMKGLVTGGLLLIECLLENMLSIHPEINPKFLLKPGELQQAFEPSQCGENMEILHYSEGWRETTTSHPRATASIIMRRIG
jgi:tellurite methyltransferase